MNDIMTNKLLWTVVCSIFVYIAGIMAHDTTNKYIGTAITMSLTIYLYMLFYVVY